VSISPTYYEHFFCKKVFCVALLWFQFAFCNFLSKGKTACKMQVKLTGGENAID